MKRILRLSDVTHLRSPNPRDVTRFRHDSTHTYLYFAEYTVNDNGTWTEGRSWVSTVSVKELASVLDEAGLLREITPSKQSGGK